MPGTLGTKVLARVCPATDAGGVPQSFAALTQIANSPPTITMFCRSDMWENQSRVVREGVDNNRLRHCSQLER